MGDFEEKTALKAHRTPCRLPRLARMGNTAGKQSWKQLLERTRVSDLLKARASSGHKAIIKISASTDVRGALQILRDNNILSAPVVVGGPPLYSDANTHDDGFVDTLDIISFLTEDAIQDTRERNILVEGWSPSPARFTANIMQVVNRSRRNEMLFFTRDDSLATVAEAMTRRKLYRVAVHESAKNRVIVDIITQSDVVAFVSQHVNDPWFSSKADATLDQLGFGKRSKMYTCSGKESTIIALSRLPVLGISAMAVAADDGKFIGQINSGMLRGLGPENISDLKLNVDQFLAKWSSTVRVNRGSHAPLCLQERN